MHIFLKQSCGHAVISDAKAAHGSKKKRGNATRTAPQGDELYSIGGFQMSAAII